VLLVTFVVIQFVPGGPVEQVVSQLTRAVIRAARVPPPQAPATGDARAWTPRALIEDQGALRL
jgi:ABC-type microcin C transport system permease subunit YejB